MDVQSAARPPPKWRPTWRSRGSVRPPGPQLSCVACALLGRRSGPAAWCQVGLSDALGPTCPSRRSRRGRRGMAPSSSNPFPDQLGKALDRRLFGTPSLRLRRDCCQRDPGPSNSFHAGLGLPGVLPHHLPDQAGFFVGLNVFGPVQDLSCDLQIRQSLANGAPALGAAFHVRWEVAVGLVPAHYRDLERR